MEELEGLVGLVAAGAGALADVVMEVRVLNYPVVVGAMETQTLGKILGGVGLELGMEELAQELVVLGLVVRLGAYLLLVVGVGVLAVLDQQARQVQEEML